MSLSQYRTFRSLLALFLVVALGAVFTSSAQQSGAQSVVASPSGVFSVQLPEGWSQQSVTLPSFGDVIAFGTNDIALYGIIDLFVNGQQTGGFEGIGGFVGTVDMQQVQGQTPESLVVPLMQSILANIQTGAVEILEPPAAHTFAGQYEGQLALTSVGYIAVMHTDQELLVAVVLSQDVATDSATMSGILESVRIPAETGEQPLLPTLVSPIRVPVEMQTVRSSDERLSLEVPGDWTVLDNIADADILAYGDSIEAAQSRLYSAKPDLAPQTAISGNGGLIILYPMSQFGIDPGSPDLSALMERALGGLQGYTVEQAAQPLEGSTGALYAVISGTERGYLALIPFGDQMAYVTATGTVDSFDANASTLLDIVKSIHVPAVSQGGGLGLGGLGAIVPEATPEVTPAGLGGL